MSGKKEKQKRKDKQIIEDMRALIDAGYLQIKEKEVESTYKLQKKSEEMTGKKIQDISADEIDWITAQILKEIRC